MVQGRLDIEALTAKYYSYIFLCLPDLAIKIVLMHQSGEDV